MQVTGKSFVLTMLALALAMSSGAWWYHYRASRQAAQFWGPDAIQVLIGKGEVVLAELGEPRGDGESPAGAEAVAGRAVVNEHVLTDAPGLIHLRHALTLDASFDWTRRRREPLAGSGDWGYALRLADGHDWLDILWRRDFTEIGVPVTGGEQVEVLPGPRLAPAVQAYLRDAGVLPAAAATR